MPDTQQHAVIEVFGHQHETNRELSDFSTWNTYRRMAGYIEGCRIRQHSPSIIDEPDHALGWLAAIGGYRRRGHREDINLIQRLIIGGLNNWPEVLGLGINASVIVFV